MQLEWSKILIPERQISMFNTAIVLAISFKTKDTLNPATRFRDALIYYFGYSLETGQWALTWTNDKGYSKVPGCTVYI